ncbi:hypothetical protein NKDENANG_03938 [Candidatus Entotheonellaceae bacterium PAL068K]
MPISHNRHARALPPVPPLAAGTAAVDRRTAGVLQDSRNRRGSRPAAMTVMLASGPRTVDGMVGNQGKRVEAIPTPEPMVDNFDGRAGRAPIRSHGVAV